MAALTLNIKTTNELEKSALATANALDHVADKETKVNALVTKIGTSYRQATAAVNGYAAAVDKATPKKTGKDGVAFDDKASKKMVTAQSAVAKAEKKAADQEKKKKEQQKESLATIKALPLALAGAAAAAGALGLAIAVGAKAAYDSKREATALLGAWTGQRAPQALKLIDGLAGQLGMSFEEARRKFVEYREAGANNKVAAQLLKTRADLIAVGLSADQADKEIAKVGAAGRDIYGQARALSEIQRAYGGVGSGAKAAAFAATSLSAAQAKLSNVYADKMSKVWERIGPAIGGAANRLADFLVKMADSDEAQAVIDGFVNGVTMLSDALNSDTLTTGLNVVKALGAAVGDVFEFTGKVIAFGASEAVNAMAWLTDKVGEAVDYLVDAFPDGAAIVDGLINGIVDRSAAAVDAVVGLAKGIAGGFADALGIKSPSKVFAEFGRNTVQGYEQGEKRALATANMPMQELAAAEPRERSGGRPGAAGGLSASEGGRTIVIEQLIVQGGGDVNQIATAIRRELQLLLQAGDLSRGLT